MPAIPSQEILDTVDGRDRDMQGVGGCFLWQRHLFKQCRGQRFRIIRHFQERHVGQYAQAISRSGRITRGALADHES